MKAIVYTEYGPPEVLKMKEVPKPQPAKGQVLVKVRAASINALDYRRFWLTGIVGRIIDAALFKSTGSVLGADIAGTVEEVGGDVTEYHPGDHVFGVPVGSEGGFAEYVCAAESRVVPKPANISFESAAAVPIAALTALQGLRDRGGIQRGQEVLIYGASGGVGAFAVQLAKVFGAAVTAVCSTRNLDMARSIGAKRVIDYTKEDFTNDPHRYDLIAAVNGYRSILDYRRALKPGGTYVLMGGTMPQIFQSMLLGRLISRLGNKTMGFMGMAQVSKSDLQQLVKLLETEALVPAVDKCYPLSETAAAFRYILDEHARGKVVITMPGAE
jgi:NADPH:quinone reductase-like Zn-dependent oxidoreductase